ncbi:MAG: alanine--tRNA ligase [Candidatus Dadabacteria bacterium]|nr:alanine--tRNA ligase [Candidatus Dadabacteria bacterium]MYC40441.1 alanine--tRNA ligase [Candidatus Dadabacteria bacterium]
MKGYDVRREFIEYFSERGHEPVRSSTLIPENDPTLLFTNAGMVQFKNVFTGAETRDFERAVSSQKCLRAGGKHNDLDNVGYTARHHTFFEMLGNFSFGDYFKEGAISYGWDLITNVYGLPKKKLWVTVYQDDDEAFDIWNKNIGVPKKKIVRMGEKDNFWSMGDTGPCGPCSEILIDQGESFGCGKPRCAVGCECDRYLELWNLVFMQFERDEKGEMTPLPRPSIDTGLGLERLTAVLQGVPSNYETDLLRGVINRIEELSGKEYSADRSTEVAMRVIADHSRALAFLISDGVFPSNEGRGYVLRRILRRAVRHSKFLGIDEPFVYRVLPAVEGIMGEAYPEIREKGDFVSQVVKSEEERFLETVDRGLELLNQEISKLGKKKKLSGKVVFSLYDTYGFPVDLTEDITRNEGIEIDLQGFEKEMEKQRTKSRKARGGGGETDLASLLLELAGETTTEFVGYKTLSSDSVITGIISRGEISQTAQEGQEAQILTDVTPFYGESGGQTGDRGEIAGQGFQAKVLDTKKLTPTLFFHNVLVERGEVRVGEGVRMEVDPVFRQGVMAHHTSTHVLHAVLKEILGTHVNQAGSFVGPDRLRFDFSHYSSIERKELDSIEQIINERIRRDDAVVTKEDVSYDEAIKDGATAIFEEKYGDRVRVVTIGDYSKELCGGTHVRASGEIGMMKIVSESASSAGVRRIEAVSGQAAWNYMKGQENILNKFSSALNAPTSELLSRLAGVVDENARLQAEIESFRAKTISETATGLIDKIENVGGINLLRVKVSVSKPAELRSLWDYLKGRMSNGVALLVAERGGQVFILVGITKDIVGRYHAGKLVSELAGIVGGKGGGGGEMAQAGGNMPGNIPKMLNYLEELI